MSRESGRVVTAPVVAATVVLVFAAWLASAAVARRLHRGRRATFLALAATAPILPVTLLRGGGLGALHNPVAWLGEWGGLAGRTSGSQFALNVALFVPAGLGWALVLRRRGLVVLGLGLTSLLIEIVQSVFGLGAPDLADLIANSAGGALGALGALCLATVIPPSAGGTSMSPRQRAATVGGTIALLLVAWLGVQGLSLRATASLEDELRAVFVGTSRADIATALSDSTGNPETIFGRIDTRPDYIISVDQGTVIEGRYSAPLLWTRRCVFVQWDDQAMRFDRGAGDECTVFRDHLDTSTMHDMGD